MFDNIPIQKRLRAMLGILGLILLFGVVYYIQARGVQAQNAELEARLAASHNFEEEMLDYEVRLRELEADISQLERSRRVLCSHSDFIQYVEEACKARGLQLIRLPIEERESMGDYEIAHISLSIKGDFHPLLQLLHQMEHTDRVATVERLVMERQQVRIQRRREDILVCQLELNRMIQKSKECDDEP